MNIRERTKWICKESKRSSLIVFIVLRILIIVCMFRQLSRGDYGNVLLCMFSLAVIAVPSLLHSTLRIVMPRALEISIAVFVFAAEILGEISNFYGQFPFWDTMLHTINGFLAAAIGFGVVDLFNTHAKGVKLTPLFVALVSFCFSMTIGVVWEFIEFGGDQLARLDMQKDRIVQNISSVELDPEHNNNPLHVDGIAYTVLYDSEGNELLTIEGGYLDIGIIDTMKDLLVNMIGAVVFSYFGYLYICRRDKYQIAGRFLFTQEAESSLPNNDISDA